MSFLRRPLESVSWLMAGAAIAFGGLMLVDPRVIDGAPAWLKPLKFGVSTSIYSATLAWILRALPGWPRLARRAAIITAVVLVLEVALIALQAARGVSSHFNTTTPFNGAVYSVMGIAIVTQTLAALAVTVALWRQTFTDRAMGWALRLGMTIAIAGAGVGGIMSPPTSAQLASARDTGTMPRSGAHTVGAPDGGPGLPGTGWSTTHGDLRASHFLGLHAMQALPLVALVVARRPRVAGRAAAVVGAGLSYAALFVILLVQALAGQPVIAPDGAVRAALVVWAVVTLVFAAVAWRATGATPTPRASLELA